MEYHPKNFLIQVFFRIILIEILKYPSLRGFRIILHLTIPENYT